jgi:hypothetical protein
MRLFCELRPGVSVVGIENGYAMLLRRAPSNPPWRPAPKLTSFRLSPEDINAHAAGVSPAFVELRRGKQTRPTKTGSIVGRPPRRTPRHPGAAA